MEELFYLTRDFADCVVPQEFGIYQKDKRILGSTVCGALLGKIKTDLMSKADMSYHLDKRYEYIMKYTIFVRIVITTV